MVELQPRREIDQRGKYDDFTKRERGRFNPSPPHQIINKSIVKHLVNRYFFKFLECCSSYSSTITI
jgi:hypothetical protein